MINTMKALRRAIKICKGQHGLSREIGKRIPKQTKPPKQQHVWNWANKSHEIPPEFCIAIEQSTGGMVTARQLRPDVFWPVGYVIT